MINMVSEGICQALAEAPINDENTNMMSENTSMRAELDDLCNMIAKLNLQVNHMQQPPSTYQQQYQVQPASPQGPQPSFAQQLGYVWNGQYWTMAPPMPFQNLTNTPSFQPQQKQKKQAQKGYCWTHGCCQHQGRICKSKSARHCDEATKTNRLGGNDYGCK
eukprot:8150595-Ditylum_brightwellii.AAC.1